MSFDTPLVLSGPLRRPRQMLHDQEYGGHASIHDDSMADEEFTTLYSQRADDDLVTRGATAHPIALFGLSRFRMVTGSPTGPTTGA